MGIRVLRRLQVKGFTSRTLVQTFTSWIPQRVGRFGTTRRGVQEAEAKRPPYTMGGFMFATFQIASLTAKQEPLSGTSMPRILPPFRATRASFSTGHISLDR